ncbi:hypothetical protein [Phenylobacterium aquaticum]|uniref:hypothetical protein n=1 Tax=Phenylobacterium aquaticum TaxID=1763816 RepID=UPI0026E9B457|nr:hypothetical protein [Phenylobacterium aquaticum]
MNTPDPLAAWIALERASDGHHLDHQRQAARRQAGVAWSGLSAPPDPPRSEAQLRQAALARRGFEADWRASSQGAVLLAVADIQRACEAAHAAGERARSAAARGLAPDPAPCRAALAEVRRQARDLLRGLRHARQALPPPR